VEFVCVKSALTSRVKSTVSWLIRTDSDFRPIRGKRFEAVQGLLFTVADHVSDRVGALLFLHLPTPAGKKEENGQDERQGPFHVRFRPENIVYPQSRAPAVITAKPA
jgi:hypothetical protein